MNGAAIVPGDVLGDIRGRDLIVVFHMGEGIAWGVNGGSFREGTVSSIDFSVKTGTNAIPEELVSSVSGGSASTRISLAHDGEFGFTAVLSINLGSKNAGLYANLYYYNKDGNRLELTGSAPIGENGETGFSFNHASDYLIVMSEKPLENTAPSENKGNSDAAKPADMGTEAASSALRAPQTGDVSQPWIPIAAAGSVLLLLSLGISFFWYRRK